MILAAVSDESNLSNLDRLKSITARLADPRKTSPEEAKSLVSEGKPIYWLTGAMHSPETGSPEMLMELAYRLAVEDSPHVRAIRANTIVLMTPVLDVDGRERMVDTYRYRQDNPNRTPVPLLYWGHYVAHDNNRDAIGMALKLTQHVMREALAWHPTVLHDLHESVPFLYISTGTGPYNAWLDPIVIDEWHELAYHEIGELTKRGVPGVWTHGFYDGWAPNYMFYAANGHNSIGRFYETFGNLVADTRERTIRGQSDRAWFRPNPPLPKVKWSLRNNVNLQAVRPSHRPQVRCRPPRAISGKLLLEKQAERRQGNNRRPRRLCHPCRRISSRRGWRLPPSVHGPGSRSPPDHQRRENQGEPSGERGA